MGFRIPFVLWPFWVFKHFFARSLMFLIVYCPIKLIKRKKISELQEMGSLESSARKLLLQQLKKILMKCPLGDSLVQVEISLTHVY